MVEVQNKGEYRITRWALNATFALNCRRFIHHSMHLRAVCLDLALHLYLLIEITILTI